MGMIDYIAGPKWMHIYRSMKVNKFNVTITSLPVAARPTKKCKTKCWNWKLQNVVHIRLPIKWRKKAKNTAKIKWQLVEFMAPLFYFASIIRTKPRDHVVHNHVWLRAGSSWGKYSSYYIASGALLLLLLCMSLVLIDTKFCLWLSKLQISFIV